MIRLTRRAFSTCLLAGAITCPWPKSRVVIDYGKTKVDEFGDVWLRMITSIPQDEALKVKRAVMLADGSLDAEFYNIDLSKLETGPLKAWQVVHGPITTHHKVLKEWRVEQRGRNGTRLFELTAKDFGV